MTEKRFTYKTKYGKYDFHLIDNEYNIFYPIEDSEENLKLLCDRLNHLVDENKELKKENQGIQNKVMRLLDYVEVKQCVTRTEIKKWWNGDSND